MKILLVCNAGMSSSILVRKIVEYAKSIHEETEAISISSASFDDVKGEYDVCLVGPQLAFAVEEIRSLLEIPCEAIDMNVYAVADGKEVYLQAKRLRGKIDG